MQVNRQRMPPQREISLTEINERSAAHPVPFPISTPRCAVLQKACSISRTTLQRNVNSAYAILHEDAVTLYSEFLKLKKRTQPQYYKDDMSVVDLVDRLLKKRAVAFVGNADTYLLLDGRRGDGATYSELGWPECLSYDEIKLSALLSVSSYTVFLNDGNRYNVGKFEENREQIQEEGIIIGLIGARLEKPGVMEYQEIVKTKHSHLGQLTELPRLFSTFFDAVLNSTAELQTDRFFTLTDGSFFDKQAFSRRIALSFDTLMIEANHRAKTCGRTAYVHVVGIGLGVWALDKRQKQLFLDICINRLVSLSPHLLSITDVYFAHFPSDNAGGFCNNDVLPVKSHPQEGLRILFGDRRPHCKLAGADEGKLLVVSYAWDGNALPGNEFWLGSLAGSGDPAAACSTQIAEIHNPHINPNVCGTNTRVAMSDGRVIEISDYLAKLNE